MEWSFESLVTFDVLFSGINLDQTFLLSILSDVSLQCNSSTEISLLSQYFLDITIHNEQNKFANQNAMRNVHSIDLNEYHFCCRNFPKAWAKENESE